MAFQQSAPWIRLSNLPFLRLFSLNLGLLCLLLSFNVFSAGFDMTVYNNIQAMDAFNAQFGTCTHAGVCAISTPNLSLLNSLPLLGYGIGVLAAGFVGETFGRRVVYVAVLVIVLIGIGVSYSSTTFAQILAGRFIVQVSVGMEGWLVPLYNAETTPAQVRGSIVSLYGFNRLIGTLVCSCITYKTSIWVGNSSWKTPLAIMFAVPSICLCFSWWVPESPRWLLRKGRDDQALKVLRKLYGTGENQDLEMELVLLKQSLESEHEKGTWADLFRGTNLKRTGIAVTSDFFNQATGQAFANQYGVIFLKSLGTVNAFQFSIISQTAGLAGVILFVLFVDRLGRRFFWFTQAPLAAFSMLVIGGVGTANTLTVPMKNAVAAMFPIYAFAYLGSFAPLGVICISEIPSLKLRDKTAIVSWTVQNLTQFVASFTVPYLVNGGGYANLGPKVGFIYGALGIVGIVWAYFYYPELKQRSLEEIDEMMRENVPARKTKSWVPSAESIGTKLTKMEGNGQHIDPSEESAIREKHAALHVEAV